MKKKNIILFFIIVSIIVFLSFSYYKKNRGVLYVPPNTLSIIGEVVKTENGSNKNLSLYKNTKSNFSIEFPKELTIKEYDEGGGSYSYVFENESGDKSFQIFFTEYYKDSITEERFLTDIPSGVIKEKQDIFIDGVPAVMFFSKNNIMGETREVWFIKNGFLYEVFTYKDLDEWLSEIMLTWKFI
ncbi:MAG TPA: hypothetical protein VGC58_02575 [Candidatus Paceibacterota bacterium]